MRALELHASAKTIQRSKGRSSVAAAAYRAGERLYDERTGLTHDYRYKNDVEFTRIYLPENAPDHYRDRATLWNAVEKKENRSIPARLESWKSHSLMSLMLCNAEKLVMQRRVSL